MNIHTPRTRKNQNIFQDWELKAIRECSLRGGTVDELEKELGRSDNSIFKKSAQIGYLVKRKAKC